MDSSQLINDGSENYLSETEYLKHQIELLQEENNAFKTNSMDGNVTTAEEVRQHKEIYKMATEYALVLWQVDEVPQIEENYTLAVNFGNTIMDYVSGYKAALRKLKTH